MAINPSWVEYQNAVQRRDLAGASDIAESGVRTCVEQGNLKEAGIWQRAVASALYFLGQYELSSAAAQKAIDMQPDEYEQSLAYVMKSSHLIRLEQFVAARECLERALEIAQRYREDFYLWMHLLGTRAGLLKAFGRFEEAIVDWKGAADLLMLQRQYWRAAAYLNNAGLVLTSLERWNEAEEVLNTALGLLRSDPHDHTEACVRDSLGRLYSAAGRYFEAYRELRLAREAFESLGDSMRALKAVTRLDELRQRMKGVQVK
jgi:tetratricopeptide (TPR) repeat protein